MIETNRTPITTTVDDEDMILVLKGIGLYRLPISALSVGGSGISNSMIMTEAEAQTIVTNAFNQ